MNLWQVKIIELKIVESGNSTPFIRVEERRG